MLTIVEAFYHKPALVGIVILFGSLLISGLIIFLNQRSEMLGNVLTVALSTAALTIIFVLTMSVVSSHVVGVRMDPIWNPFPAFIAMFGGNQANRDQLMLQAANVLMTVPISSIIRTKFSSLTTFGILIALIVGIECAQYFIADGRTFEIADIITNSLGVYIGIVLTQLSRHVMVSLNLLSK